MRIISGNWRGRPLIAPKGTETRPTADRTREGLFSMLVSRLGSFEGLRVLDLFAGSGALGLEALSRGAGHCTFVEQDSVALDAFLRAAAGLSAPLQERVIKVMGPASALIARRADHFRAHLMIETAARAGLQRFLKDWLPQLDRLPGPSGLRWSIDVDPLEVD